MTEQQPKKKLTLKSKLLQKAQKSEDKTKTKRIEEQKKR